MSTVIYSALTINGGNENDDATGAKSYLDAVAALVPAEVLGLHALILSLAGEGSETNPAISHNQGLAVFIGLAALSVVLFASYRWYTGKWEKLDFARMLIPPIAFVAWTMLQPGSALDALVSDWNDWTRTVLAVVIAIFVGIVAKGLGYKADPQELWSRRSRRHKAVKSASGGDVDPA